MWAIDSGRLGNYLRDGVVASSLQFSIIRMRNARPRP